MTLEKVLDPTKGTQRGTGSYKRYSKSPNEGTRSYKLMMTVMTAHDDNVDARS